MDIIFGKEQVRIPTKDPVAFQRLLYVIKERCVGRKYFPSKKTWFIPATKANFLALKDSLPDTLKKSLAGRFIRAEKRLDAMDFLRPYQKQAVKDIFNGKKLISLPTGAGKTIVALSFEEATDVKRSLFVVPSPLKKQWKSEAKEFFGRNAIILEGSPKKRKKILDELPEEAMLVVGYETARVTPELHSIHFEMLCLDEAHKVKNSKTKTYKMLRGIRADTKILLTATPMVNRPTEIFNVVNFAHPHYFDYWAFHERYVIYEDVWTGRGYVRSPVAFKNLTDLHEELKPVMVFKRKEDILSELPEKVSQYYWIDPSPEQKRLHHLYQEMGKEKAVSKNGGEYQQVLACLTMMRRVSDSPEMLKRSKSPIATMPKNDKAPKVEVLKDDIIPNLEGKTVIFTEYADMADILFRELSSHNPMLVKGGMDTHKVIEEFKESEVSDILVSTDVLNFGINLQFASNVVHYDQPWSPAKITQREGRIHRIGQKKNTLFISLITKETVEAYVNSLLKDKKDIFESTMTGGQAVEQEVIREVFLGGKEYGDST